MRDSNKLILYGYGQSTAAYRVGITLASKGSRSSIDACICEKASDCNLSRALHPASIHHDAGMVPADGYRVGFGEVEDTILPTR